MAITFDGTNGIVFPTGATSNPGAGSTTVSTTDTQTLTNKTLTSPTVTSPTITSPTITGANMSSMASTVFTQTSSQVSTSGTNIDFQNIPSWVKQIVLMFNGVSTNGASEVLVQLGTASGFTTSGYLGSASTSRDSVSPGVTNYDTGFLIRFGTTVGTAASVRHGICTFNNFSGNTWTGQTHIGLSNVASNSWGAGLIALGGTLTQVRITTVNGTDAFDAGSLNILYK